MISFRITRKSVDVGKLRHMIIAAIETLKLTLDVKSHLKRKLFVKLELNMLNPKYKTCSLKGGYHKNIPPKKLFQIHDDQTFTHFSVFN